MNKIKTVLTLLFLMFLTVITIFLPIILNTDSSSRLTEESSTYTRKNSEVTPKQVAKLYTTGEISSSIVLAGSEALSPSEARNNIKLLTDSVFAENDIAKNYVTDMTEGEIIYYYKESRLIVIENNPVALDFININFQHENEMLEMTFEEKTKTLIGFVVSSESYAEIPIKILSQTLCGYYENELSLNKHEYHIDEERFSIGIWYSYKCEEDIIY